MDQDSSTGVEEPLLPPAISDHVAVETEGEYETLPSRRESFQLELQRKYNADCGKPSVWYILPCIIMVVVSGALLMPIVPPLKIQWYTSCDLKDRDCKPNSDEAQFYSGIFDSIRGALCFMVVATIGRISDAVGRKPVIIVTILFSSLPTFALFISHSQSPVLYFTFSILAGLAGTGMAGSSTAIALNAYISDIYGPQDRVVYFGYIGAAVSLSLTLSPLLTTISTQYLTTQQVYFASLCLILTNLLFVALVVPESLHPSKRNTFSLRTVDPLAPLKLVNRSPVLKWLSAVVFFAALPEVGLVEILLIYCDTVLGYAKDQKKASAFNGKLLFVVGFAGIFAQTLLLRAFRRANVRKTTILLISQLANAFHMLLFASLVAFPHEGVVYVAETFSALVMLSSPASMGIVSTWMGPLEQGFAMGTLGAVKGLTAAFAPFLFSTLQSYMDERYGLKWFTLVFAASLAALSILFILFPLRNALKGARLIRSSHSMLFSPTLKQLREHRGSIDLNRETERLLPFHTSDSGTFSENSALDVSDSGTEEVRVLSTPGIAEEISSIMPLGTVQEEGN